MQDLSRAILKYFPSLIYEQTETNYNVEKFISLI